MFQREVKFEKGYNYLHETGPQRRGQHGMQIRFLLIGSQGATQFVIGTGWVPLGLVDGDPSPDEVCHLDTIDLKRGLVSAPYGIDLGYHWLSPTYDGQDKRENCEYLNGQTCYYDGSGLRADELLRDFISNGEQVVWDCLTEDYIYLTKNDQKPRGDQ